jgi:PAS domain S-box-containing protein
MATHEVGVSTTDYPQTAYRYFRSILDSMQDELLVIDRDYRIIDANAAFLSRIGREWKEVIGRRCYEVTFQHNQPCDGAEFRCPLQQVWESEEPVQAFHIHHDPKHDKTYYFNFVARPVYGERGQVVQAIAVCHDVTAERRLEAKLAAIYALGRELVLSRDEAWIAQTVVNAAERVLEFQLCHLWLIDDSRKTLICRAYAPLKEPPAVSRLPLDGEQGITVAVARSGEAIYLPDVSQDARYVVGHPKTRSELCVPLKVREQVIGVLNVESEHRDAFDGNDRHLLAALADEAALAIENARLFEVTRQQREKLRTLAAWLAEAEEAERRRLARELHDQVGQNLTALSINLNFVRAQAAEGLADVVRSRLDDSLALIEQTVECIRRVMADLRPPVLDNHGLVAALRWYGSQIATRTGIAIIVQGEEPVPRLPTSVETALFRIAQEALTNVVKHAQARRVTITLEVNAATACLVIADNGIGFEVTRLLSSDGHRGWGLLSMAERAEGVGGHCRIESRPGQGTRVVVEVPR